MESGIESGMQDHGGNPSPVSLYFYLLLSMERDTLEGLGHPPSTLVHTNPKGYPKVGQCGEDDTNFPSALLLELFLLEVQMGSGVFSLTQSTPLGYPLGKCRL